MEITARFTHDTFPVAEESETHLVVSIKAPTLDWVQSRPRVCVLPVIDLSGSMRGPKIEYARQSLLKLVDQLTDRDFTGLIGFESRVHTLVEPQPATAETKTRMREAIERLRPQGGTNLSAGISEALRMVRDLDLPQGFLKRAILFTDGQPTEGLTDSAHILKILDSTLGSATLSAFGYGTTGAGIWGGCDMDFLTDMARVGKGNFAYVQDPDDALSAFGKELGGLLSTYATDLQLRLEPLKGKVLKLLTDVPHEIDVTDVYSLSIPDILSEEGRHFVFTVRLDKQSRDFPEVEPLFDLSLRYTVLTEEGSQEVRSVRAQAGAKFAKGGVTGLDNSAMDIAMLHQMLRAQLDAEELAKKGLYQEAGQMMGQLADRYRNTNFGHLASAADALRRRVSTSVSYASSGGFRRSVARAGAGYRVPGMDAEAGVLMADCDVTYDTASMRDIADAFTGVSSVDAPESDEPSDETP